LPVIGRTVKNRRITAAMYPAIAAVVLLISIVIVPVAKAQDKPTSGFANLRYYKALAERRSSPGDHATSADVYESGYHDGYCLGVVAGILRSLYLSGTICGPGGHGVTNGQGLLVVVAHMEQHPERLGYDLTDLVADALHCAFACHGSGGK
jgi:hypothetical protein